MSPSNQQPTIPSILQRYYQKYMDQHGAQGKSSGYKKYFQKYMGSGSGGYEQYMSVAGNGFGDFLYGAIYDLLVDLVYV